MGTAVLVMIGLLAMVGLLAWGVTVIVWKASAEYDSKREKAYQSLDNDSE